MPYKHPPKGIVGWGFSSAESVFLFVLDAVFHTPGVYHRGLGVFDLKVHGLFLFFHKIPSGISMYQTKKIILSS